MLVLSAGVAAFVACGQSSSVTPPLKANPQTVTNTPSAEDTSTDGNSGTTTPSSLPPGVNGVWCFSSCSASGVCSGHGGVNCFKGPDEDGSVICADGYLDSPDMYDCPAEPPPALTPADLPGVNGPWCFITCSAAGACANHGGVNCMAGADVDGSVICRDSYRDSPEMYDCPATAPTPTP